MQILSENYKEIVKILHYIQRFGELTPKLIGALSGVKNAEEIISFLKKNYEFRSFPYVYEEALRLSKHIFVVYTKKWIDLPNFYNFFDGLVGYALRDLLHPEKIYLMIYFNGNTNFIRVFDYLLDNELIYHYEYLGRVKENHPYSLDYSRFNFEKKEFEGIGRERLPFENPPLYDDFDPDYYDVIILGKKQEKADMNLKEISETLNIPFKDVLYHYQKHIVGKGLIAGYLVYFAKLKYRLHVIFEKKETLDYLSKIPTFYYVYKLDNEAYIGHVLGFSLNELLDYTDFIKRAKYLFNDNVEVSIHPYNFRHMFTASIPYEHFTKEGKWDFNVERMIMKVEKHL